MKYTAEQGLVFWREFNKLPLNEAGFNELKRIRLSEPSEEFDTTLVLREINFSYSQLFAGLEIHTP